MNDSPTPQAPALPAEVGAPLFQYVCLEGTFILTQEGRFYRETDAKEELPWFKNTKTGKPMIPRKRRSFVSLVKMRIRDGDFNP